MRGYAIPKGGAPELRQDCSTKDMIFDIPTLIETCSRGITLYPGDVIATGTCAGVGMGFKPPKWLGPGDAFRIEVDGLGSIENKLRVQLRAMAFHLIDKTAVEDEGSGDAVVCVHGLGGSTNTWTPLLGGARRHACRAHRHAGQRTFGWRSAVRSRSNGSLSAVHHGAAHG